MKSANNDWVVPLKYSVWIAISRVIVSIAVIFWIVLLNWSAKENAFELLTKFWWLHLILIVLLLIAVLSILIQIFRNNAVRDWSIWKRVLCVAMAFVFHSAFVLWFEFCSLRGHLRSNGLRRSHPCECDYLQRAAENEHMPIRFDSDTGEYQFFQNGASGVIRHCPSCGGAAPESQREKLFATIPRSEEGRLAKILDPIKTISDAIEILGQPDFDDWSKTIWPESEGKPPRIEHHRDIRYTELSDVAEIHIQECSDGRAFWQLVGKYVGPKGK